MWTSHGIFLRTRIAPTGTHRKPDQIKKTCELNVESLQLLADGGLIERESVTSYLIFDLVSYISRYNSGKYSLVISQGIHHSPVIILTMYIRIEQAPIGANIIIWWARTKIMYSLVNKLIASAPLWLCIWRALSNISTKVFNEWYCAS